MADFTKYEALDLLLFGNAQLQSGELDQIESKFLKYASSNFKWHHNNCGGRKCDCEMNHKKVLTNIKGWMNDASEEAQIVFCELKTCWESSRDLAKIRVAAQRHVFSRHCAAFARILSFAINNKGICA